MCVLAHVLEAAGLSTVSLISIRPVAEKMRPPRALHGEFPLGRPLGRPNDPVFQHDVLRRAFGLLDAATGPVLTSHPATIVSDETPLACALPPRYDPDLPPAVDEAHGLRAAYDRAVAARGTTSLGRAIDADDVPDVLGLFDRIANGTTWTDVGLPASTVALVHDIRAFYDEAAIELVGAAAPGGRSVESWFYDSTEAGRTVLAARQALREAGAPFPLWFYMAPGHR